MVGQKRFLRPVHRRSGERGVALAILLSLSKVLDLAHQKESRARGGKTGRPEFTKDQELLIEIRDLLKQKGRKTCFLQSFVKETGF